MFLGERRVGGLTELQQIDPHSYGHNSISFLFSWAANRRPGGLASLGAGISTASYLQLIKLPVHSPRSRLYPEIPRPDAPVIYTFPILTAWPGSICYIYIFMIVFILFLT